MLAAQTAGKGQLKLADAWRGITFVHSSAKISVGTCLHMPLIKAMIFLSLTKPNLKQ